ncbi:hypothetical protein POM88_032213 [Heracleum sosnowskyi]|uniref:Endonuclease/exonuclease/phosphatase domain-containing protein n=1 Tax=Heracleum sosnowskyi TaxID=360622 RepID=A0AAD8MHC2_9APIA|nr:hypothetical protein POM88_032213 [Heracleum sosnowskyi]
MDYSGSLVQSMNNISLDDEEEGGMELEKEVLAEDNLRNQGFDAKLWMMTVESQGHSGGIALLWRHKDEVFLRTYSKNHIDAEVRMKDNNPFRLTGIYGEPDRSKRHETWQLIRTLSLNNSLPWVLIGDMNNVCSQEDKKGGRPYPQSLIKGFTDVLDDCSLLDMNLQGYQYTWERGAGTSDWIEVRLDRALSSASGPSAKF